METSKVEATHFQLYKRAKHVFAETLRVLEFREVCLHATEANGTYANGSAKPLHELGRIMDESHKSSMELADNSCPEVDELVRLAKEAGAYGSRITGTLAYAFLFQMFVSHVLY
jgi:galactokinase